MSTFAPYSNEHTVLNGPEDARPTALRIVRDQGLDGQLQGKVFVVTGATSGLGYETARAVHATGADIFITGRNTSRGEEVTKAIASDGRPGKVVFVNLELDSLKSVHAGASEILQKTGGKINVLICNAGVMMCPESKTSDGFELQFGTNHIGHFALFQDLKHALLSSAAPEYNSRVVVLTSFGHRLAPFDPNNYNLTKGYNPFVAYAQAKTANIYMSTEIERRYGSKNLHAHAIHPGMIDTGIGRHLDPNTAKTFTDSPGAKQVEKSPGQGAATTILAAISKELEGKGGNYMEDCEISGQAASADPMASPKGYAEWAFNKANEEKLWVDSLAMIGKEDED